MSIQLLIEELVEELVDQVVSMEIIKCEIYSRISSAYNIFKNHDETVKGDNCLVSGNVQSGKTQLIIAVSWIVQHIYKKNNVVILRNITQDVFQFNKRVEEFNINFIKDPRFYIKTSYLKEIYSLDPEPRTILCLYNVHQLCKLVKLTTTDTNTEILGKFTKKSEYVKIIKNFDKLKSLSTEKAIIFNKVYDIDVIDSNAKMISINTNCSRKTGEYHIHVINSNFKVDYYLQIDEVDITSNPVFI